MKTVHGRYVTSEHVYDLLARLKSSFKIETIGRSVMGKPIKSVEIGDGPERILMWSQMHGNESTTTKAVLDLINYLAKKGEISDGLIESCTLKIIPVLSPDGAEAYTRVNANDIDLNRDAQNLSQPESMALRKTFDVFSPHFCFNLHDQRTIYNVGHTKMPATVSFLSPSVDEARTITESRTRAMELVVLINRMLQTVVPGQVGRYDDGYNLNCVGDTFQTLNCPTVLFEAGHFQGDYQREMTRKLIFQSLLTALTAIGKGIVSNCDATEYFEIPENGKQFFDVLIKNAHHYNPKYKKGDSVGLLYQEFLGEGKIILVPKIEKVGTLNSFFGHKTYDCAIEGDLLDLHANFSICSVINNI
ncbi:MAG: M14 family zinc carboxypeptidase [Aurantibacter sp.]